MSCKKIEISSVAFVKIQLHLAKYPHCAVNGLLLGCKERASEDHVIEIVDVVPLFHQCLQLTPMLEIALIHVDSHCASNQLYIAGYYEAPELLSAKSEPSQFSTKIGDKIKSNAANSRLLVINNKKVPGADSMQFYSSHEGNKKWIKAEDEVTLEEGANETLLDLLDRKAYRELVDFDNHLNDITQHWLNQPLSSLIRMTFK